MVAALACGLLSGACATPSEPFYHQLYRERYAITDAELQTLQFYISTEVLAHAMGPGALTPGGVAIVPADTPGLVREVGPDWLRVAFRPEGEGVLFAIRHGPGDSSYMLATRTETGEIVRVSELPRPVLRQGEQSYQIVEGAQAYLLVNDKQLQELIERRPHATGLER